MVRYRVLSHRIGLVRWYAIAYQNENVHVGKKAFIWKRHRSDTNETIENVLGHVFFHYNMHAVAKFQGCINFLWF